MSEIKRLQRWELVDTGTHFNAWRDMERCDMTPEGRRGKDWADSQEYVCAEDVAPLEAEVERLRELTRMDLDDAREWVQAVAKVTAQRDQLAQAMENVADRCGRWYTSPELLGADFARGRTSAMRDCAEWIRTALAELEEER